MSAFAAVQHIEQVVDERRVEDVAAAAELLSSPVRLVLDGVDAPAGRLGAAPRHLARRRAGRPVLPGQPRLGHHGTVRLALAEALAVADREGPVQPVLDLGEPVACLLRQHADPVMAHPRPCARGYPSGPTGVRGRHTRQDPAGEPLTRREAEVLRYLDTLLTRDGIAAELGISPTRDRGWIAASPQSPPR